MSAAAQPFAEELELDPTSLDVRLLGPLAVRRGNEAVALGGAKPRALLALLVLDRENVVSIDRIVDEVWGDSPPASARHMVAVYVSKLRQALGERVLLTRPPGYVFVLSDGHLDTDRFERLLDEGREALTEGNAASAAARLDEALSLWRGAPLTEFRYEPFAQAEIARLEELHALAEEERIEARLALGLGRELVGELEEHVARSPLRERFRGQLMTALYRAGRQGDALAVYQAARSTLVEELGIEPSPELRRLERAILAQEEWLSGPQATSVRPRAAPDARRTVTILAGELVGRSGEEDVEARLPLIEERLAGVKRTLRNYGADVRPAPDGTFVAIFGGRIAYEDDPVRAVRAAAELRELGLVARAALDTGEVLAGGDGAVHGPVLRAAVELLGLSSSGEILVGDATWRLGSGAARFEGLSGRVAGCWRLVEAVAEIPARPLLDVPLVGRTEELAALGAALEQVVDDRRPGLAMVVGEPGIGKTRLAREFTERLGEEARVLVGRCLAYGDGITYWPLREILREAAGGDDLEVLHELVATADDGEAIVRRLTAVAGFHGDVHSVEDVRWAARRLFETLAQQRPLVLVLDDVHWAEPTLLDLLRHVLEVGQDAPVLLVALARPDPDGAYGLLDDSGSRIAVDGLSAAEGETLMDRIDPGGALLPEQRARIVDAADGNPLFLEQLVAFAGERRDGGALEVPPTLRALLAERLDRLGPGERVVVECAAIVGREFSADAVAQLLPASARARLPRHFEALTQKGLVRRDGRAFRFAHVLVQQAAYRSISKARRSDLHERHADWLEGSVPNVHELIGHHLEAAFAFRVEIGRLDAEGQRVAARAGAQLAAAGRRAFERGDTAATIALLRRAGHLLVDEPAERLDLVPALGRALFEEGRVPDAEEVLARALEEANRFRLEGPGFLVALAQASLRMQTDPPRSLDDVLELGERALAAFERLGDERGIAKALDLVHEVHWNRGDLTESRGTAERALRHAERAGDLRLQAQQRTRIGAVICMGLTPIDECVEFLEATRAWAQLHEMSALDALCLLTLGRLRLQREWSDEAHELLREGLAILEGLGMRIPAASYASVSSLAWSMTNPEFIEDLVRDGYAALKDLGEKGALSTVAVNLAHVLYEKGDYEGAERMVSECEALVGGASDDVASEAGWRGAKAMLLARRGRQAEADALIREAVAIAGATNFLDTIGDVQLASGEVHALAGRIDEAVEAIHVALRLYQEKGFVTTADAVRRRMDEVRSGGRRLDR